MEDLSLDIENEDIFPTNSSYLQQISLVKRSSKAWKPVDMTVFNFPGDSSGSSPFGQSGAAFKKYPTKFKIKGKNRKVYPVALHPSLLKKYRYAILEIGKFDGRKGKKVLKRTFVHVVDSCASGPCPKNHNSAEKNGAMLVDLQYAAAKSLGIKKNGYLTYGSNRNGGKKSWFKARVVGKMGRKDMFRAKVYWDKKKFNCNYVPKIWLDGMKPGKPISGNKKDCY